MIARGERAVIKWDPSGLPDFERFAPYTPLVHVLPLGRGEK